MAGSLIPRHRTLFPDLMDWLETGLPAFPFGRGGAGDLHTIPIEVIDQEGAVLVRAELPGVDPEHGIEVTVEGDVLAIRAEHSETKHEGKQSEFRYGSFQRAVRLPFPVPEEGVTAEYAKGVLELTVPKPEQAKASRTIKVEPKD